MADCNIWKGTRSGMTWWLNCLLIWREVGPTPPFQLIDSRARISYRRYDGKLLFSLTFSFSIPWNTKQCSEVRVYRSKTWYHCLHFKKSIFIKKKFLFINSCILEINRDRPSTNPYLPDDYQRHQRDMEYDIQESAMNNSHRPYPRALQKAAADCQDLLVLFRRDVVVYVNRMTDTLVRTSPTYACRLQ